jgi:uncharacterized protein (TIGR03437 family)
MMNRRGGNISRHHVWRLTAMCVSALAANLTHGGTPASATAPSYTAPGIVNAATGLVGALSPNAIASIYGTNLAWTTQAVTAGDLAGGALPTSLAGVTVYVDNIVSALFFVSPGQINFLIPYEIEATSVTVFVERQGITGPAVTIPLGPVSPGFFQWNGNFAVAEHADGSLISPAAPAQGGEIVVLYAAGLGHTIPDVPSGYIVSTATWILAAAQLQILISGDPCAAGSILYAGLTPGFAGLYQINLQLPAALPPDATIQMSIGAASSPAGVQLYTQ